MTSELSHTGRPCLKLTMSSLLSVAGICRQVDSSTSDTTCISVSQNSADIETNHGMNGSDTPGSNTQVHSPGSDTQVHSPGSNTQVHSSGSSAQAHSPSDDTQAHSPSNDTQVHSLWGNTQANTAAVHALNILRALYRDSRLGEHIVRFIPEGVEIAVCGFSASLWPVSSVI